MWFTYPYYSGLPQLKCDGHNASEVMIKVNSKSAWTQPQQSTDDVPNILDVLLKRIFENKNWVPSIKAIVVWGFHSRFKDVMTGLQILSEFT